MRSTLALLTILILSLATTAMAEPYFAISGSSVKYMTDDNTAINDISGNGFNLNLGYKFPILASVEAFYKKNSADGTQTGIPIWNTASLDIEDSAYGFGGRLFFLAILNIKAGIVFHSLDVTYTLNGATTATVLNGDYTGWYAGVGLRAPLWMFDIFADFSIVAADVTAYTEAEIGLRVYF